MGDASLAAESCRADDVVVVEAAEVAVVAAGEIQEGGGGGELGGHGGVSNSGEDDKGRTEEGDRNYAGNRWPRQETLALLKIRSDMDATFRDSTLKGPLWEDVSRKMAALGYNRSAKKCKEKFENVYKYHKRTKDGRTGKSEGKTYRFFDQLEAFGTHHHSNNPPLSNKPPYHPPPPQVISTSTTPWTTNQAPTISHIFAPSPPQNITNPTINIPPLPPTPTNPTSSLPLHTKSPNPSLTTVPLASSNLFSSSTSSSTASDEEFQRRHKRKRKWKEFFRRLTKEVLRKQEELQMKFLETVEKCEHDRMVREEAWRLQETARINREHEILVQERSTAAAKDAAVIAFLQKVSGGGAGGGGGQHNTNGEVRFNIMSLPPPQPPAPQAPPSALPKPQPASAVSANLEISKLDYNETNNNAAALSISTSRWPKAEVQALIQLRTNLDLKYQDNGPKGPLWEEISAGMRRMGYNRSAKRCKEKWENINKYFKKVKDNNKKRSEDSKTCPYFHLLDALYREKNKADNININSNSNISCNNIVVADQNGNGKVEKPVEAANIGMEPLMVQPERQWPLQEDKNQLDSVMEDIWVRGNADPNHEEEEDDDDDNGDDDGEDDDGDSTEDDAERGGYEIVTNKQSSMDMVE
ncbi:hypothetical protein FEM48_Zijuj06G0191600 [Ziziphus jujuba var. spinosa]|uniref:Myb-like domain-containing protein n=1 Tax=Ziziphus jujuba var. spinosa TaxID=714518 RepID=A0A978VB37_ZIZJJ|nr:hypothetical protein FEM48_Zijuj06G0191600 [Ziziphus jujuba var. spinosa]